MKSKNRQLVLDLPHREALGRDDFLVTRSNQAAVALIDLWPDWPARGAILVGPAGSGKTHLVEVWRHRTGAARLPVNEMSIEAAPSSIASGAVAVEDLDGGKMPERALFHLLNLAKQQDASVLLTAKSTPEGWGVELPDLLSRLKALPVVAIQPADDDLLRGVLVKLFVDRQLAPDEQVVSFILTRMPRSLEAARELVAEVDRQALVERADITRPLVARVLQELTTRDLFGDTE
jgi:chromosomal replication initiation ATPase DnaA